MTIQLINAIRVAGVVQAAGTQLTLSRDLEKDLISRGDATDLTPEKHRMIVESEFDPVTGGKRFIGDAATAVYASSKNAVRGVRADLSQGRSACLFVLSDSTGNETTEWVYKTGEMLAAEFSSARVEYRLWNDTAKDYDAPIIVQAGIDGEQWVAPGNMVAHADAPEWVDDIDVRVKVKHNTWIPVAGETLLAKFGASGNRSFRFEVETSGGAPRVAFRWTTDGSTEIAVASATFSQAAGSSLWLRATLDVDNGTGGYTMTFYKSDDGVAWTQISQSVTSSGATSVFKSTAHWEAGSRSNNGSTPIDGVVFKADVRAGIGGYPLLPASIGEFRPLTGSTEPTRGGSPTLYLINGAQSGQNIAYFTTNAAKMIPRFTSGQFFISTGHNEGFSTTHADISGIISAVRSRIPYAPGYAIMQNPRIGVATMQRHQPLFAQAFADVARSAGLGVVDVYKAFVDAGPEALTNSDGVHPNAAGSLLWRDVVADTAF